MGRELLPAVNALLNASSATLLVAGVAAIRARRVGLHVALLFGALAASSAFLVCYVVYHLRVGSVRFAGSGWLRPCYVVILFTHTILAVVMVPLIARTLWLAIRRRFAAHVGMARWTVPIWLYVSMTGVVVYWMLYHL